MSANRPAPKAKRIYRVDKFLVPDASREEFLAGVHLTHDFIGRQEGFLQDFLIEKRAGPDMFNVITIVEWDSEESFHNAIAAVRKMQAEASIVREDRWGRLGVTAELGDYHSITD